MSFAGTNTGAVSPVVAELVNAQPPNVKLDFVGSITGVKSKAFSPSTTVDVSTAKPESNVPPFGSKVKIRVVIQIASSCRSDEKSKLSPSA